MNIFTNRDIKRLFIILACTFALFTALSQLFFWLSYGAPNMILLLLFLLLGVGILGGCYLYFRRQQQMINNAISQINLFVSGDTDARIESDNEGSLYTLFHAVNTLAITLNTHAVRSKTQRTF